MKKMQMTQSFFIAQGYLNPDEESWINYEHYPNMNITKLRIQDFLQDFQRQHQWLADNIVELAKENEELNSDNVCIVQRNQILEEHISAYRIKFAKENNGLQQLKNYWYCEGVYP